MAEVTRDQIVAEARTWLGVRWQHQGRSRAGVDCAGVVIRVAQDLGLTDFDITGYARLATDETMAQACREQLVPVAFHAMQPGDVLTLAWQRQRHIGIVGGHAGALTLIHAYLHSRKVVEARLDDAMMARAIAAFRFPEVA
jgi:cell wall-associated NlpC family hydrolase